MVSEAEVVRLRKIEAAARAALPILGIGPTSGFSAARRAVSVENYRAMARLALVLDGPSFSGEED